MAAFKIALRANQKELLDQIRESSLVVAPTGFGKTIIALAVISRQNCPFTVVLPTTILCDQFVSECEKSGIVARRLSDTASIRRNSNILSDTVICLTPHLLKRIWETEQLASGLLLRRAGLIIDECHRYGNPDSTLTRALREYSKIQKFTLCLTASPGSKSRQKSILRSFGLKNVLEGACDSPHTREIVEKIIGLSADAESDNTFLSQYIQRKYRSVISIIGDQLVRNPASFHRNQKGDIHKLTRINPSMVFQYWRYYKECYHRFLHVHQSPTVAQNYAERRGLAWSIKLKYKDEDNPKFRWILETLPETGSVLVFFDNYSTLIEFRKVAERVLPPEMIKVLAGKSKIPEKVRLQQLSKIRAATRTMILSTSVAEEGVDIKSVKKIYFYEPVTSSIRYIQRIGRTARHESGFVDILKYRGTYQNSE